MSNTFNPEPAARRLADASRSGAQFDALPEHERPVGLAQGYAVQDALRGVLGEDVAGWKVAASNVAALRSSEFGLPLFGYLAASRIHDSGAALPVFESGPYTIEVEVAFEIARDVRPADDPLIFEDVVAGAYLAIEVVRSRYINRKVVGAASFVADDSAFYAFIKGDALSRRTPTPWRDATVSLLRDGEPVTHALSGDANTDPVESLRLFWEHAATYDIALPAGALITTGTLIAPLDAAEPGRYEGRLGQASVWFTIGKPTD